jgi:hypothetical protein
MYKHLFNRVKKIIPKISETEIIALKSGGVSIDREIFEGRVNYKKLLSGKNINKIKLLIRKIKSNKRYFQKESTKHRSKAALKA